MPFTNTPHKFYLSSEPLFNSNSLSYQRPSKALCWYTWTVVIAVLLLIFKGALVTSHNAGLAVPDWPTTFGENMFLYPYRLWIGGVFYEHGHRVLASVIGVLTVVLSMWLWLKPPSFILKILGCAAFGIVCLQGTLGGLTVIYQLPDIISIAHGILGQTFFLVTITIAFLTNEIRKENSINSSLSTKISVSYIGCFATATLYLQLLLGAMTRHGEAGLAVLDFPTIGGSYIPLFNSTMMEAINQLREAKFMAPVSVYQVTCHVLHRFGAIIVAGMLCYFATKTLTQNPKMLMPAFWVLILTLVQIVLGIATILSGRQPLITSFHVLTGAILLGLTWWLTLSTPSQQQKNPT
jgi:cytochrome c oxidase assembly protein subunit 15